MVFLDFFIRQIHEVDEDNIDVFKIAFQIRNIRLHQFGLTRSTNARDDLDAVSYTHLPAEAEIRNKEYVTRIGGFQFSSRRKARNKCSTALIS